MPLTRSKRLNELQDKDQSSLAAGKAEPKILRRSSRRALGELSNKRKASEDNKAAAVVKRTKRAVTKKGTSNVTGLVSKVKEAVVSRTKRNNSKVKKAASKKAAHIGPRRRSPRLSSDSAHASDDNNLGAKARRLKSANVEEEEFDDPNLLVQRRYRLERPGYDGITQTHGIAAHDKKNLDDALMNTLYLSDIYQNYYHDERKRNADEYMDEQFDINAKMRMILIDWLVEVHMKFRLVPETLYLCVNIIDRYCSKTTNIRRSKLQLVGVTALLIACKYEEIYPPEVRDCVYITDRAYDRQQVIDMEYDILKKLEWRVTVPTSHSFLLRFLDLCKASKLEKISANYFLERTLQEHDLLRYRGSVVAACCVVLAINCDEIYRKDHNRCRAAGTEPGFPPILMEYTNFNENELRQCIAIVSRKISEETVTMSNRQLVAVKRKYDQEKYENVSALPPPCPHIR